MKTGFKSKLNIFLPFVGFAVVLILFIAITGGRFVSGSNLNNIINQSYTVMLVAAGATLIYAHGGMDFSVGSVLALSEMCAALAYEGTGMAWLMLPTAIVTALVCGFITGIITVKLNVPPFISSLCMQFTCRGILNLIVNTRSIGVTELPDPTWVQRLPVLAAAIVIIWLILNYTKIGKANKAIGENILSAKVSGINVDSHRMYAYLISAVTLGIAAYFNLMHSGTVTSNAGLGLEMDVIIALVLGGLSLSGGYSSSVRCAVIGSLIIVTISNGLSIIGLSPNYIGIIKGIVFLIVVIFTYKHNKSSLLPR